MKVKTEVWFYCNSGLAQQVNRDCLLQAVREGRSVCFLGLDDKWHVISF